MSLTMGSGPFGDAATGRFNFEPPGHVVLVEPFPRRVRATLGGRVVLDSTRAVLVHESGRLPYYAFPGEDVDVPATRVEHAPGYVSVGWSDVDAWFEEDERVYVHPRDPYHRIDTFSTSRRVVVQVDGTILADSTRTHALFETGLPVRYYFPVADVRRDLLVPSETITECAYKGTARHWSARLGDRVVDDVAWSYEDDLQREGEPVRGLVAFYNERVDLEVDGVRAERPRTGWSR